MPFWFLDAVEMHELSSYSGNTAAWQIACVITNYYNSGCAAKTRVLRVIDDVVTQRNISRPLLERAQGLRRNDWRHKVEAFYGLCQ